VHSYESAQQRIRSRRATWLVTGAAGFIGSHLAEHLLKLGQQVVALDNLSTGRRSNLPRGVHFIEGDIRDLDTCRIACAGADVVLHQAALGSVPRSIDDPVASHQETEIGKAISPYALTKHINELYAGVFDACYGFKSIGLRYFNVFGARQDPSGAYASVIPAWVGALLRGQTAYVNGDGSIARDFCHVENVVQANLLAATVEDPAALGQAYNVALGDQTTLNELFTVIREFLSERFEEMKSIQPVHRAPRPGDIPFSRADISKAERLLGYRPAVRIREGLQKTVEWYADNLITKTKEAAHV